VLLSGLFLSLVIEFLQYAFGTGISEADDLILNTLGALIGYALYRLIHKLKRK
jgi:glycopeptide antibiotics resistance protein